MTARRPSFNEAPINRPGKCQTNPYRSSTAYRASMRPRSIDRGNAGQRGHVQAAVNASMRPRSIDRGNSGT